MKLSRRTTTAALAGSAAVALTLAGCAGGGAAPETSTPGDQPVTLTVATFNNFGYTDELLAQYTELHPNVTIEHTIAATSNDARSNYFTKLGAGSGLGWWLAILLLAAIRERTEKNPVPAGLKGPGITMITIGFMAMAFIGFSGMIAVQ